VVTATSASAGRVLLFEVIASDKGVSSGHREATKLISLSSKESEITLFTIINGFIVTAGVDGAIRFYDQQVGSQFWSVESKV